MSYLKRAFLIIVIVGVGCLALFLVLLPNSTDQNKYSNDFWAIHSIRNIVTSQITYSDTTGSYAPDLATLLNEGLIDSVLASGTKEGYTFITSRGRDGSTFTVNARPLSYGRIGNRSFFADESGVIRYTREDRPTTVEDKPLGQ